MRKKERQLNLLRLRLFMKLSKDAMKPAGLIPQWWARPYPLIESRRDKLLLVLGFGLFTYVFLLIYRPFGAAELGAGGAWFLLGFGGSVSVSLAISYFALPNWLPRWFRQERWQLGKEILFLSFSFLLVATLNYLYNRIVGGSFAPQHSWIGFVGITFAVGVFPLIILIFLTELYLNRKNKIEARRLNDHLLERPASPSDRRLAIQPETSTSAPFLLHEADFLFALAENNYTTVFHTKNGRLERELLRLSLRKLEEQLAPHSDLIRCHRSYMVNRNRIASIVGNARNLSLQMEGFEEEIPVSRSFPREELVPSSAIHTK